MNYICFLNAFQPFGYQIAEKYLIMTKLGTYIFVSTQSPT